MEQLMIEETNLVDCLLFYFTTGYADLLIHSLLMDIYLYVTNITFNGDVDFNWG